MFKKLSRILPLILALPMLFAFQTSQAQDQKTFRIWYYEQGNAMGKTWDQIRVDFQAKHPEIKVEFELKQFMQTVETARMVLNSNEAPDIMEINKGNATAGLYAAQGLLTDLTQVAADKGWDKIMSPSIQVTCRYDERGIMGSGNLYGITNYGEFVMVYYNKDMFKQYGIEVPTTLEELEAAADKFVAAGITPFTLGAGGTDKWPPTHNWYEFVLYKADRSFVDSYQLLKGDLDFSTNEALTWGTQKFADWINKGYFNPNATGTSYDDANTAFVQGKYPMNLTGSWQYGQFMDQVKDFDWGVFLMPGKKLNTGSGGNMWIVPQTSQNKDLAYEFIDMTMQPDAQAMMANFGGIPVKVDPDKITDPKIRALNEAFGTIVDNDGLAFYPDWPVPGYMDTLTAGLQELLNKTKQPADFLSEIAGPFNDYKSSLS